MARPRKRQLPKTSATWLQGFAAGFRGGYLSGVEQMARQFFQAEHLRAGTTPLAPPTDEEIVAYTRERQAERSRARYTKAPKTKRGPRPKYDEPYWRNVVESFDTHVKPTVTKETGLRGDRDVLRELVIRWLADQRGLTRKKAETLLDSPGGEGVKLRRMLGTLRNRIVERRKPVPNSGQH